MAEFVTPLGGQTQTIAGLRLSEAPRQGMISYRGDLGDPRLASALQDALGAAMPAAGRMTQSATALVGWMSPDELLILTAAADRTADTVAAIGQAMAGAHHLVVDVSDGRALISLSGHTARDILAKVTPADLRLDAAPVGSLRRSRIGQVAAAMAFVTEGEVRVLCFRSVAQYVFDLLAQSARDGRVGLHG